MTTSTKLILALALVLSATSATLAKSHKQAQSQEPLYNMSVVDPSAGGTTLFRIGDDGGIAGER